MAEHAPPIASEPEVAQLDGAWKLAAYGLLVLTLLAVVADHLHPPIGATLDVPETGPGTEIVMREAVFKKPLVATAGAFGLSLIRPNGAITVPGHDGELLLRLRVAANDCRKLVAKLHGSCEGRPTPALMPEGLGIVAPDGALETRLEMTTAPRARLGQNGEEGQTSASHEWSLAENAETTTLTLRCLRRVALTVTDLPATAHPECDPTGPLFELAFVDRKAYAPILAFAGDRTVGAVVDAARLEAMVERGTLSLGDEDRNLRGVEPTAVAIEGDGPVEAHLKFPPKATSATLVASGKVSSATVDEDDVVPSRLARAGVYQPIVLGTIGSLLVTVLGLYGRALLADRARKTADD